MVTDAMMLAQALLLIYRVQASLKKRLVFAGIFLPRVLVIGAIIGQLSFIHTIADSKDPTYDMCDMTIIEEMVQCLSIVTACWGQLKPFLTWLKSNGGLQVPSTEATTSYKLHDRTSRLQSLSRSRSKHIGDVGILTRNDSLVVSVMQDWEVHSQSSQTQIIPENQHAWVGERSEVIIHATNKP
ncbi:hypothetical protein PEBR_07806 [Penicillium brasilianum]|uniref:Rhodopsin domain-containing protein n=1 Tax=Penicillium brasilianum TaxID=104259 RepID=A0A1S9RVK3_PENBI|nr:hypothetical protein PEBR_07806 [Penicillium brasilianum]